MFNFSPLRLLPNSTDTPAKAWARAYDPIDGAVLGLCRRLPPPYDGLPLSGPDDWCGEYMQTSLPDSPS